MATPKAVEPPTVEALRSDFPILESRFGKHPLVYLDNAATSQKPQCVLDRMQAYYSQENANIHRGVHALSQRATESYEAARRTVARFIGADSPGEIVFTRGATEAINLVASGLGHSVLKTGDTVLLTEMEHHANIVPWQLLQERMGLRIAAVRVTDSGLLDLEDYHAKLEQIRPALVSLVHISNSMGVINPARDLIAAAHREGIPVLLDMSQSVPHMPVNVTELDCDWMVFSGHKAFGPTGIGVLYGKADRLAALPPYQGGGDMIESVRFTGTRFKDPPERFEAGTPHIAGAIGLAAALDYLSGLDRQWLLEHEESLLRAATEGLESIRGLRLLGNTGPKASVVSFTLEAAHPHDLASFLDTEGIAIRSGHHCTQPLMERFGISGTARASFAFYNTHGEVDALVRAVDRVHRFFG